MTTAISSSQRLKANRVRTNGGTIARATPIVAMPASTDTSNSDRGGPTREEHSTSLPEGRESAGPANGRLLTPEEVAERLNVSPDWVRDHSSRKTPRLPVIRLGGGPGRAGLLRYRASEIERFIDEMAGLSARHSRAV